MDVAGPRDLIPEDEPGLDPVAGELERRQVGADQVAGRVVGLRRLVQIRGPAERGQQHDRRGDRERRRPRPDAAQELGRDQDHEDPADVLVPARARLTIGDLVERREQPEREPDRRDDPKPARHRAQPHQTPAGEPDRRHRQHPAPVVGADRGLVARRRQAEQRGDRRRDRVEHVQRRVGEVLERGGPGGLVSPAQPPEARRARPARQRRRPASASAGRWRSRPGRRRRTGSRGSSSRSRPPAGRRRPGPRRATRGAVPATSRGRRPSSRSSRPGTPTAGPPRRRP